MHVLHIEDRRENRLLVRKLLEARGFRVTEAADGLSGIQLAQSTAPDLILLDINIPGLDGYEVATKLKGDPRLAGTPVVAITAEGDRSRALALGFDGFIVKPIQPSGFVDELLAFRAGRRERIADSEKATHLVEHSRRTVDRLEAKVRELTQANERLRELDRLKMEVLRNVSHELSTPMTPLVGYVKLLSRAELGPVNEPQRRVLDRMDASLARLKGLIENLLNVTRFATGAISLHRQVAEPWALLAAAVEAVRPAALARQVAIELPSVRPRVDAMVVDAGRVEDALRQILDNAIKFGPAGGRVRVEAGLLLEGDGEGRQVELAVVDEGPGIPAEQRDRVVEPFYQIDGSATRTAGGAGLGLAIAERTASLHGGRLVITGAPGGGARVALRLPTHPAGLDPTRRVV